MVNSVSRVKYIPAWVCPGKVQRWLVINGHKPGVLDGKLSTYHKSTGAKNSRIKLMQRLEALGVTTNTAVNKEGVEFTAWAVDGKAVRLELE